MRRIELRVDFTKRWRCGQRRVDHRLRIVPVDRRRTRGDQQHACNAGEESSKHEVLTASNSWCRTSSQLVPRQAESLSQQARDKRRARPDKLRACRTPLRDQMRRVERMARRCRVSRGGEVSTCLRALRGCTFTNATRTATGAAIETCAEVPGASFADGVS